MNEAVHDSYAFIVLFKGADGVGAEQMLRAAVNPEGRRGVMVHLPGTRGLDFLAAGGALAAGLNAWWKRSVPPNAMPVYLAMDEPGLEEWIPGTEGPWFVGVKYDRRERTLAALAEPVFPVPSDDPEEVTEQAMQALGGRGALDPAFHPSFPYRKPPARWDRTVPRLEPRALRLNPLPASQEPPLEPQGQAPLPAPPRAPARPISYDLDPPSSVPMTMTRSFAPAPSQGEVRSRLQMGLLSAARRLGALVQAPTVRGLPSLSQLGTIVNANRPIIAGFASRKGGVGKTTHAAATAATIGEAFDGLPDTAALVDGNITNPDSWALNPPAGSATVRMLVSRLSMGQDPPSEQYALTPRLALYPESRSSDELYTQAEIDIVAEYLRRRHSFIAVDLPNSLPSLLSGGAGAVAAAWLAHCDVIVLPFNADPRARQGLMEYINALQDDAALAHVPVVAPYIVSSKRAIAADAAVQADIAGLRRRDVQVFEIPDDQNALLALLRDRPINQASPALRRAYVELTHGIVTAVTNARRAG